MKVKKTIKKEKVRIYEVVLEWDDMGKECSVITSDTWRVTANDADNAIEKCRKISVYGNYTDKLISPSKKRTASANLLAETNA